ncbi:hypothetical protein ACHAXA_005612 [Cyclostephanos tholiformis]|jgi:hypothetical protein|uniref:Uncharacterized protein n=1 Tax=Cyclostephanos tholiformis TaxID=382380 RepID=A0ABD3SGT7_9STRA
MRPIELKYRIYFTGKRFLPHVFRRTGGPVGATGECNKDGRILRFHTIKSRKVRKRDQQIYNDASVDSTFVRDLEDSLLLSETAQSLHCAESILDEISIFFDPKNKSTFPFEEVNGDGDDDMQSAGMSQSSLRCAESMLDEISIFFDPKIKSKFSSEEFSGDGDDEEQSAGYTGMSQCFLCG